MPRAHALYRRSADNKARNRSFYFQKNIDMNTPPEIFETERLILRRPKLDDAPDVFTYASDPSVTKYVAFKTLKELKEAEEFLGRVDADWCKGKAFAYAICLKNTDRLIGMIAIHENPDWKTDFGYILGKEHWRKGYTTEAFKTLIAWTYSQPEVFRVGAVCDVNNPASARVMEKAGLKREAVLKRWHVAPNNSPEPADCYIYSKCK